MIHSTHKDQQHPAREHLQLARPTAHKLTEHQGHFRKPFPSKCLRTRPCKNSWGGNGSGLPGVPWHYAAIAPFRAFRSGLRMAVMFSRRLRLTDRRQPCVRLESGGRTTHSLSPARSSTPLKSAGSGGEGVTNFRDAPTRQSQSRKAPHSAGRTFGANFWKGCTKSGPLAARRLNAERSATLAAPDLASEDVHACRSHSPLTPRPWSVAMTVSIPMTPSPAPTPSAVASPPEPATRAILFFDGVCALCNANVDFWLVRDRRHRLAFAPL